jgi:hypothetical protein
VISHSRSCNSPQSYNINSNLHPLILLAVHNNLVILVRQLSMHKRTVSRGLKEPHQRHAGPCRSPQDPGSLHHRCLCFRRACLPPPSHPSLSEPHLRLDCQSDLGGLGIARYRASRNAPISRSRSACPYRPSTAGMPVTSSELTHSVSSWLTNVAVPHHRCAALACRLHCIIRQILASV